MADRIEKTVIVDNEGWNNRGARTLKKMARIFGLKFTRQKLTDVSGDQIPLRPRTHTIGILSRRTTRG